MNTILAITALVVALALVAAFTVAIPALQAHASNGISDARNKGQQGFAKSGGQGGKCVGIECCGPSCVSSIQAARVVTLTV
jgi:hypothetical protein